MTFLIQMSGVPGSGKSTIAREVGARLPAIVLDHDETKSAILRSGVDETQAGVASYEVIKSLSASMIARGLSVIIDSPCLYAELLEHGMRVAEEHRARYRYVECRLDDLDELDRRLRSRVTLPSQVQHLDQNFSHAGAAPQRVRGLVEQWAAQAQRPPAGVLLLDTARPIRECTRDVLSYLPAGAA